MHVIKCIWCLSHWHFSWQRLTSRNCLIFFSFSLCPSFWCLPGIFSSSRSIFLICNIIEKCLSLQQVTLLNCYVSTFQSLHSISAHLLGPPFHLQMYYWESRPTVSFLPLFSPVNLQAHCCCVFYPKLSAKWLSSSALLSPACSTNPCTSPRPFLSMNIAETGGPSWDPLVSQPLSDSSLAQLPALDQKAMIKIPQTVHPTWAGARPLHVSYGKGTICTRGDSWAS